VNILLIALQCEVVAATGNFEQLRIRTRDASSAETCAALMGAIGLGSKPNYPWDQYPSRARTKDFATIAYIERIFVGPDSARSLNKIN